MVDMGWNHRQILGAVTRSFSISLNRRASVLSEHRAILASIKAQNADGAAALVALHVQGSSRHWIEQMQVARRR